jgi:hypothetical protein
MRVDTIVWHYMVHDDGKQPTNGPVLFSVGNLLILWTKKEIGEKSAKISGFLYYRPIVHLFGVIDL